MKSYVKNDSSPNVISKGKLHFFILITSVHHGLMRVEIRKYAFNFICSFSGEHISWLLLWNTDSEDMNCLLFM
jgi:hypothetical protein